MTDIPSDLWRECENVMIHGLVRAVDDAAPTVLGARLHWATRVYWVPEKALFAQIVFRGEPSVGILDAVVDWAERLGVHIKGWGTFLNGEMIAGCVSCASHALAEPLTAGKMLACVAHEWGHYYVARKTRYGQIATSLVDLWREAVAQRDWVSAEHEGSRAVALASRFRAVDEGWARFLSDKITDRLGSTHSQFEDGMAEAKSPEKDYKLRDQLLDFMADVDAPPDRNALESIIAGHRDGPAILAQAAFCRLAERQGIRECLAALNAMYQWADPMGELLTRSAP